jgi:hypothetical protein
MPTKRLTLELSTDQYDFLRREAGASGTTIVGLIRKLIEESRNRILQGVVRDGSDPLYGRKGSFNGPADLAEDHDRHLYRRDSK